tara:strand:+ start:639 stop:833 length:195 start_codon:yes stop_codon:yes gene_type:complete
LSDDEMKGRLEMVEAQRNDAMNKCVIQAGHIKVLLGTVDELQKEIDGLKGENMIEDAPGEDGED